MTSFSDLSSFLNNTKKDVLSQIGNISFYNTQNVRALERDAQSRIYKGSVAIRRATDNKAKAFESQARLSLLGGNLESSGISQQASNFRLQSQAQSQALGFNLGIDAINTTRRLKSAKSQMDRTLGQQLVQTAASGISLSSKSALAAYAETSNAFSESIRDIQIDAANVKKAKIFQSQASRAQLENQARALDYQAKTTGFFSELQALGNLQQASAIRKMGLTEIENLKSSTSSSRLAAKSLQSNVNKARDSILNSKRTKVKKNPYGVTSRRTK